MSSQESIRTALASFKADTIKSNALVIDAKAGNDRIIGGSAAQTLYGGSGNDTIQGVGGDDILWGDGSSTSAFIVAGKDTFVFEKTLTANGVDTVMDFGIAGHKIAGVLQAGTYVADSLDLSRVHFTGLPSVDALDGACAHEEEDEDDGEEVHINAANVNDYVSVKGGDLYIDTDGLGAGQAEVWAHLKGVAGGDLVNLKFDDFQGQIEAKAGFDFEVGMTMNDANYLPLLLALIDGDLDFTQNVNMSTTVSFNGKPMTEEEAGVLLQAFVFGDIVSMQTTAASDTQALASATWSINEQQALGTIDVSTWTTKTALLNYYKLLLQAEDQTGDGVYNYDDVLFYDAAHQYESIPQALENIDYIKTMFTGQVVAYFDSSAFAAGETVELIGTYQGSSVAHSIVVPLAV